MLLLEIVVGGTRSPAIDRQIAPRVRGIAQQFGAHVVSIFRKQPRPISTGSINTPEDALLRGFDMEDPHDRPMRVMEFHSAFDTGNLIRGNGSTLVFLLI